MEGMRRSIGVLLVALVAVAWCGAAAAWADGSSTNCQPSSEDGFVAHINDERTSRGLGSLAVAGDLSDLARRHSGDMAAVGHPYHDPNIRAEVQNWQEMGDNVGTGPSVDAIHTAFMNSQVHRDEILNPDYTEVGAGCVWGGQSGQVLYVTEIFVLPQHPVAQAPAPVVVARPARVVRPLAPPKPVAQTAPAPAAPAPTTAIPTPAPVPTTVVPVTTAPVAPWPSVPAVATRPAPDLARSLGNLRTEAGLAACLLLAGVMGALGWAVRSA